MLPASLRRLCASRLLNCTCVGRDGSHNELTEQPAATQARKSAQSARGMPPALLMQCPIAAAFIDETTVDSAIPHKEFFSLLTNGSVHMNIGPAWGGHLGPRDSQVLTG